MGTLGIAAGRSDEMLPLGHPRHRRTRTARLSRSTNSPLVRFLQVYRQGPTDDRSRWNMTTQQKAQMAAKALQAGTGSQRNVRDARIKSPATENALGLLRGDST